jgi:hypothetical protein
VLAGAAGLAAPPRKIKAQAEIDVEKGFQIEAWSTRLATFAWYCQIITITLCWL